MAWKSDQLREIQVVDYYQSLDTRRVMSDVEPGYLKPLLPNGPPEEGEKFEDIRKDIESKIMPGLTHWCVPLPFVFISVCFLLASSIRDQRSSLFHNVLFFLHRFLFSTAEIKYPTCHG